LQEWFVVVVSLRFAATQHLDEALNEGTLHMEGEPNSRDATRAKQAIASPTSVESEKDVRPSHCIARETLN
jgi:hypothetical protein